MPADFILKPEILEVSIEEVFGQEGNKVMSELLREIGRQFPSKRYPKAPDVNENEHLLAPSGREVSYIARRGDKIIGGVIGREGEKNNFYAEVALAWPGNAQLQITKRIVSELQRKFQRIELNPVPLKLPSLELPYEDYVRVEKSRYKAIRALYADMGFVDVPGKQVMVWNRPPAETSL